MMRVYDIPARIFIKNRTDTNDPAVRAAYGSLCGALGIVLNIILFAVKLFAGIISGSIAIMSDSLNNLSDAGSSLITLIGFKLSRQKPDEEHPFGHGRIEYLSGLLVSVLIIVMGFELGKSSVEKIISPELPIFTYTVYGILIISVLVKFLMFLYNRKIGKLIDSETVKAAAKDSFCDMLSTSAVLACAVIYCLTELNLDAYCGLLVAIFILRTGIGSVMSTVNPLLGQPPKQSFVDEIEKTVLAHEEIIDIHDLVVHDYGPGRVMISLHAEVPASCNILEIHDTVDNIENELKRKLGCAAVIHTDPVVTDDPMVNELKEKVFLIIRNIDKDIGMHDFRVVIGQTHTNLIFDILVPFDCKFGDTELCRMIRHEVSEIDGRYFCVINVDKNMVKTSGSK